MPPRGLIVDFMHLWDLAESSVQWLCVVVRVRIYQWIESCQGIASSDFESFLPDPSISFSPILPTISSSTESFYAPTIPLWTVSMTLGTSS
jgi:hypothetical protein